LYKSSDDLLITAISGKSAVLKFGAAVAVLCLDYVWGLCGAAACCLSNSGRCPSCSMDALVWPICYLYFLVLCGIHPIQFKQSEACLYTVPVERPYGVVWAPAH
ncbi:hypothetical protein F5Y03DRAFT_334566, partial [Xylaria venustula]